MPRKRKVFFSYNFSGRLSQLRHRYRSKIEKAFRNNMKLPEFLFPLFWEYNPETIDIVKHAGLIMNRIMERGFWTSMIWLQGTYSKDQIISFLEKKGSRTLSSRELNYWAFISGIPPEKRQKWLEQARERSHVWRNRHSR